MAMSAKDVIHAQEGSEPGSGEPLLDLEGGDTSLDVMVAQIEVQVKTMQDEIRRKVNNDTFDGVSGLADQVKDLVDFVNASKALQADVADVRRKIATGLYEDSATELAKMVRLKFLAANHFKITAIIEGMERNAHDKAFERAHQLVSDLNEMQEHCADNSTNSTTAEPDSTEE